MSVEHIGVDEVEVAAVLVGVALEEARVARLKTRRSFNGKHVTRGRR